ncbi:hypothetical protein HYFRA_00006232 [Hymenoscyphus fraxineus]|uniref:Aba 3 protein n=1 Tax=Hymenoscyphus fraxineus TaxID=746836 RepID=A0A9N9LDX7_9HELO|nr:hypothetical protein HYFRA_00006232 [Hymenoscyphus fraxineus]
MAAQLSAQEVMDEEPILRDQWYYPQDLENDLQGINLREDQICEAINTAWEYVRIVIPAYTNWNRYIAFTRLILIAVVVEMRGNLIDVVANDNILGFHLEELIDTVFAGTPGHKDMAREFRCFLLFTAQKVSRRRSSDFFRRYVNALAHSPQNWFRLRDCDALARLTMAGAMACNDWDEFWFGEEKLQVLMEIAETLYDAVAFYKHRAEGEIHNTFGYIGSSLRVASFHRAREVLWRFEVAWARIPRYQCVLNFIRNFGGPLHMTARRYRFVEDGLAIGKPETENVVHKTRQNFKLWNRTDAAHISEFSPPNSPTQPKYLSEKMRNATTLPTQSKTSYYSGVVTQRDRLMFNGLLEMLEIGESEICKHCRYRQSYGAEGLGVFGGVELCGSCKEVWRQYMEDLLARAEGVFPDLLTVKSRKPASTVS